MNIEALAKPDVAPSDRTWPPSTVFIVDDDAAICETLQLLLDAQGWQTETFASAEEFLSRRPVPGASCLILDVELPGVSGLDLQSRLVADRPDIPIIFLSAYGDVRASVRAMKAGAIEFLTKPAADDAIIDGVRQALDRSRRTLEREAKMATLRSSYASLTRREREVMVLVTSGLLNKQVAGELGISEITVKAHRGHMMRKMNASSLPALVTMVDCLGLLQQTDRTGRSYTCAAAVARRKLMLPNAVSAPSASTTTVTSSVHNRVRSSAASRE